MVADSVRRAGYAVRVCEGPDRRHPCPMVEGHGCPLVDEADVVVNLMNSDSRRRRQVLGAVSTRRRPPAIIAEMTTPTLHDRLGSGQPGFDPDHVDVVRTPLTRDRLLDAIGEVLRRRRPEYPVWGDGFC
jgi:hypothetical protein